MNRKKREEIFTSILKRLEDIQITLSNIIVTNPTVYTRQSLERVRDLLYCAISEINFYKANEECDMELRHDLEKTMELITRDARVIEKIMNKDYGGYEEEE